MRDFATGCPAGEQAVKQADLTKDNAKDSLSDSWKNSEVHEEDGRSDHPDGSPTMKQFVFDENNNETAHSEIAF